jgi:ribonuclease VapC
VVVDGNRSPALSRRFDEFLQEAAVGIEPVTAQLAELAREAYRAFGRGSGHPAHLNFGDCFAYALAMERDEALLFKGNDFSNTDVRRV